MSVRAVSQALDQPTSGTRIPAGCAEEWAQVDRCRVPYWHAGHGEPLVLLHGLLGYSFSWRRVIQKFAEHKEVFAPDMPGSGFSDCSPTLECSLHAAAARLRKFLDATGIISCDLLASSYGGTTALMLAATEPSRIKRLVLVSPANPWSQIGRKRIRLLRVPLAGWMFPKVARKWKQLHGIFLRRMYADPAAVTADTYAGYSEPLALGGRIEHAVRTVQTWHADMTELKLSLAKATDIPTLLIWGAHDRAVERASAEPLSRNFRLARIEVMQGAGHLPYEECPEEFVRLVNEFLQVQTGK
jgi:pimeloyl-ACP methyl ester carboxylesterase